jgi:hypothetical protein
VGEVTTYASANVYVVGVEVLSAVGIPITFVIGEDTPKTLIVSNIQVYTTIANFENEIVISDILLTSVSSSIISTMLDADFIQSRSICNIEVDRLAANAI